MPDFPNKKESNDGSSKTIKGYFDLLNSIEKRNSTVHDFKMSEDRYKITDAVDDRERIKNDDLKQNIALKKAISTFLCLLLLSETALVFIFSLFQAIKWPIGTKPFELDEWSFKLLITATIAQITIMLRIVVKYLFPNQR